MPSRIKSLFFESAEPNAEPTGWAARCVAGLVAFCLAALSGGQRQRVAIARAVAIKPRVLLFDEPTSALDPEMTAEVLDMIQQLRQEGSDLVLVTHEMGFARVVADRVAFLAGGRIVECADAETLFERPASDACRKFLARILKY